MSTTATSPVLGTVLLLVVTAALAGAVGSVALGPTVPEESPRAVIDLRIDASANRLTFVHRGGAVLDAEALSILIRVNGTALDFQPPVPFFSARGFRPGPTGPFNSAADSRWSAGETANLRVAGTNDPSISEGSAVVVTLSTNGTVIAEVEGTG